MPTIIHFVRHAEGVHNLCEANNVIPDPHLTDRGHQQCATLRDAFPHHDRITHLVASPLRRTLQTCLQSFQPGVDRGLRVIALPEAQEVSDLPCDTGSDVSVVAGEFGHVVDFQRVGEGWNFKGEGSPWEPHFPRVEERARATRVFLREIGRGAALGAEEEAHVVLVTHGGFLHFLTEDWYGVPPARATAWSNTECRSFEFVDPHGNDPEAAVRELPESRQRRGETSSLPTAEEQAAGKAEYYARIEPWLKSGSAAKA